jgi:hypothetical protein
MPALASVAYPDSMKTSRTPSLARLIAAWTVGIALGAIGIFIAAQLPIALPSVVSGFVIVIVGVMLAILIAIRRPGLTAETTSNEVADQNPVTRRIRRAFYGGRSSDSDRLGSALRTSGHLGVGLLGPEPGPFDSPPEEDVALDPDQLPWELRDASESDRARS